QLGIVFQRELAGRHVDREVAVLEVGRGVEVALQVRRQNQALAQDLDALQLRHLQVEDEGGVREDVVGQAATKRVAHRISLPDDGLSVAEARVAPGRRFRVRRSSIGATQTKPGCRVEWASTPSSRE